MCLQIYEFCLACQHVRIIEHACNRADETPLWSLAHCPDYHYHERQNVVDKCGMGRYYCGVSRDGPVLNEVHKRYEYAQALVAWHKECDIVMQEHLNKLNQACDQVGMPQAVRSKQETLSRAMMIYRGQLIESHRAHYLATQLQRKIQAAKDYFFHVVPAALQRGLAPAPLILPEDQPWTAPLLMPQISIPASHITPAEAANRSGPAGEVAPAYILETAPVSAIITPRQDLGTLASGSWLQAPRLDNLPIGRWTADRSTAIDKLARMEAVQLQRERSVKRKSTKQESASPIVKRRRTTRDCEMDQAPAMPVQPTQANALTPVSVRRSRRSVKPINYSEEPDKSSSDGGDSNSDVSVYVETAGSDASSPGRPQQDQQQASTIVEQYEEANPYQAPSKHGTLQQLPPAEVAQPDSLPMSLWEWNKSAADTNAASQPSLGSEQPISHGITSAIVVHQQQNETPQLQHPRAERLPSMDGSFDRDLSSFFQDTTLVAAPNSVESSKMDEQGQPMDRLDSGIAGVNAS